MKKESLTGEKVERTEDELDGGGLAAAVKTIATAAAVVAKVITPKEDDGLIAYEDFAKVRLLTVKVVNAVAVDGSDKLIRLTVDDGKRQDRTIVSGIRAHFTPEHMVGRTICIVDNLKPRKIFGILSEGMILAAGEGDVLRLITPEGELAPGVRLG